jgi:3-isopropylmalate/(R)-2-methylmalate dehydratase large subunit
MQPKPRKMLIHVAGDLQLGYTTLHYISSQNYPPGATGYFVERRKRMNKRMTVCNLSIEMGARGMIAPDQTTLII